MAQFIVNGIISGATYALVALGFALVFYVGRFYHFAHAGIFTIAAYTAVACKLAGVPLPGCLAAGVVAGGICALLIEVTVYKPLRQRRASLMVVTIASLGVYVIIENALSLIFGDGVRSLRSGTSAGWAIGSAYITPVQLAMIGTAAALCVLVAYVLNSTVIGRCLRAIGDDPELAKVTGIDADRTIAHSLFLSGLLAGVAGLLVGLDIDIVPTMGMQALLMGIVATIIGGTGNIWGAAAGGLLLGLFVNLAVVKIGAQWQNALAFLALLLVLVLRPQGLWGPTRGHRI